MPGKLSHMIVNNLDISGDNNFAKTQVTRGMHLSPNVLTSGRIFGSALVEHTTMGTLSGL